MKAKYDSIKQYENKKNNIIYSSRKEDSKTFLTKSQKFDFKDNNVVKIEIGSHRKKKSLIDCNHMFDIERELNEIRSVKNQTGNMFFKNN